MHGLYSSKPITNNVPGFEANITMDFNLEPSIIELNGVQVNGVQNKESNSSARSDERISPNIVSIISAKTIENCQLNVANVLQRVSGVSMMKNSSGNNTQLVIRGIARRYKRARW